MALPLIAVVLLSIFAVAPIQPVAATFSWPPSWWPWQPPAPPAPQTGAGTRVLKGSSSWGSISVATVSKGEAWNTSIVNAPFMDMVFDKPVPSECIEVKQNLTLSNSMLVINMWAFRADNGKAFLISSTVSQGDLANTQLVTKSEFGNYTDIPSYRCTSSESYWSVEGKKPGDTTSARITVRSFEPTLRMLGYTADRVEVLGIVLFPDENYTVTSTPKVVATADLNMVRLSWMIPYLQSLTINGESFQSAAGAVTLSQAAASALASGAPVSAEATVMFPIGPFYVPVKIPLSG